MLNLNVFYFLLCDSWNWRCALGRRASAGCFSIFLQRSQVVELLTCCFPQVTRAMFIAPLPTPHPQHQTLFLPDCVNRLEGRNSSQKQRPHPTPPQTCRSIDHVSMCKQHHSGVASTMCAKATNIIIPPHPSPPQTCRSIDHVPTCKQHHSGVASTMCAKATNVITPPHQTPPQTCRSKKPGQQKTAFYSYGFQAVGKNMELETFVLKSTCALPKINTAHRPWERNQKQEGTRQVC